MCELKKNVKVFTSKSVGTGPSSYEKIIYRAAVSQRLRSTALQLSTAFGLLSRHTTHRVLQRYKRRYVYLPPDFKRVDSNDAPSCNCFKLSGYYIYRYAVHYITAVFCVHCPTRHN